MLKIDLSHQAAQFLHSLPSKQARQIAEKIKLLSDDPGALPSEPLKGYAPLRRLKSGEYRIVYLIADATVKVALIGKRNDDDIYKALARKLQR